MVITKAEMTGPFLVYRFNEEAIGRENITLAVVDEDDPLDFVKDDDVIISRTFCKKLLHIILNKGCKSTAEEYSVYQLCRNKERLSDRLGMSGVLMPRRYSIEDVDDGNLYFVKPSIGGDSLGITTKCICSSKAEVLSEQNRIGATLGQTAIIEDFIYGKEYTVACVNTDSLHTYAIEVDCTGVGGIQTQYSKEHFLEYCSAANAIELNDISARIFHLLGLKHHARMDFRKDKDGKFYLIDINLLPGLGPTAHLAKAMLLTENISYIDAMKAIVKSAS